ncbi:MAG: hypothetical protein N2560_08270 [Ignavibacteria bacterium]|nr:hypothetical protein [Ignavibacteria bacterium]
MKNSIVFIILIFVNIGYIISRDFPKQKICFSVGANYNFFIGSFNKLPNVPNCCPEFSFGKGLGFNSNLSYRHIVQDKIWVGGKIGLITLDAEFRKEEPTFIITPQGLEEGSFEHLLRANLSNVFIQPFVEINLYKNLFFSFGLDFGYLFKNSFYQKETIIKPYGYGTFLDSLGNDSGKRYRNEYNGTIPNLIKNQNFVTIGLSYDLPLNKHTTLLLRPDVFFRYPFTNLVRDIKWRVSSLGGNLSLVFAPKAKAPKKRLKEQRIERDTIKIISKNISQETIQIGKENFEYSEIEYDDYIIELTKIKIIDTLLIPKTYILEGNVVAVGLDENGNEIPNPRFLIEEIVSNKLVPLLPYIFFEEGSSEIPKKYKLFDSFESAKNFNISELFYEGTIDIYHHILNIIGQRMRIYTDADLTLVGCNSDFGIERTNINLSKQRAIAIKEYLINVWGIAPHRIKIEARNLPEKPSIPTTEPEKC